MVTKRTNVLTLGLLALALVVVPALGSEPLRGLERNNANWGGSPESGLPNPANMVFVASANGFSQVPAVLTPGRARFRARVSAGPVIEYELRYQLGGPIKDAFLLIGQPGVNGGMAAALCVDEQPPGPGIPGGAPPCPAGAEDVVTGTLMPEDILPTAALQGVNDMEHLIAAMISRITYVRVASHFYPGGEVRGQVAPMRAGNGGGPGGIGSGDVLP